MMNYEWKTKKPEREVGDWSSLLLDQYDVGFTQIAKKRFTPCGKQ